MKYHIKIGTHSIQVINFKEEPYVGLQFMAPCPTGGIATARITNVDNHIIFAEWF